MTRQINYTDITTAWSGPVFGAAYVTRKAPASGGAFSFMLADFDSNSNLIRTFDLTTGRMDLRANSAAGSSQGATMVVNFTNSSPANNDLLGHFAWRGNDTVNLSTSQNTFGYINVAATNVTGTGSNLNSKMSFGVMVNQTAGAGNAQPNTFLVYDGANLTGGAATFFGTSSGTATFGSASTVGITATSTGISTNLPVKIAQEQVTNKTTNYTVTAADAGSIFTTITAAGEVDFTLPTGMGSGTKYTFMINANQTVKIIANTGQIIRVGSSVSTTAGNVSNAVQGCCIELIWLNSALTWIARSFTGTWTAA